MKCFIIKNLTRKKRISMLKGCCSGN